MVTLGAEAGVETVDEEQGTSYMELKPSTTLLVPMELMEGHEALVGCPQPGPPELHQATAQDEPTSETHVDFSLMLDMDDEVKDTQVPPLNDDLEFSVPPTLSAAIDDDDEPVAKLEVILVEKEAQDAPVSGEACEQEQGEEPASMADVEGSLADDVNVQIFNTDANHEPEDVATWLDAELTVEQEEPAGLLMPEASPPQELPEDVAESMAVEDEVRLDDENPETEACHKEPEQNGLVNTDAEVTVIREAEFTAVEKNDLKASETEEGSEGMNTDMETNKNIVGRPRNQKDVREEEEAASDSQVVEEPVEEAPASQGEKSIPSTPTGRTTIGKSVTFISPRTEEKEELQEDGKLGEAQSNKAPVLRRGRPRKSQQNKEPTLTPRRSSRRAQQEPPEEEPVKAKNQDAAVVATSKLSSPARRRVSQRAASTRSSQSGNQESSATELGGSEEDVADTKPSRRSSSRTLTPSKRRTPESSTPRRSSRRRLGSADVVPVPLEMVKEENEQEEVFTSVKHTSKQTKAEAAEEQPVLLKVEEEEKKAQASSPGRTSRHSSRNSLAVYSQVRSQKNKTYLLLE